MRASKFKSFAPIVFLAIAACISAPEPCAEGVDDVVTAARCSFGGGFDAALEQQRRELARLQEERRLTDLERIALEREADRLSGQKAAYLAKLDVLNGELVEIRTGLIAAEELNETQSALKIVLLDEVASLQALLADEQQTTNAQREEIIALTSQVESRKTVLASLTRNVLVE